MRRTQVTIATVAVAAGVGLLLASGCGVVGDLAGILGSLTNNKSVTVELVNASPDFDVDVQLFYGDEQDTIESLLTNFGTEVEQIIGPGETYRFTRDCEDLQAIIIEDADLRVLSGLGPEDSTDVLRDGTDFSCGDTLVFTFDHSAAILDFAVYFDRE